MPTPQSNRFGPSVYAQVVTLLVLVTVPPLIGLGWTLVDRNRRALTVDAQHYHRLLAERARAAIEAEVSQAHATLDAIAEVLTTDGLSSEDARFALALVQLRTWGRGGFVSVYGPDGTLKGSVHLDRTHPGTPPPTIPDILRVPSFATGAVKHHDGRPVLQIATPATREGDPVPLFWVYTELELQPLATLVGELGETPPLRDPEAVFVVDGSRQWVLARDAAKVGTSAAGYGLFQALTGSPNFRQALSVTTDFTEGGQPMMGALATIPSLGWAVGVQEPQAHAYETLGSLKLAVVLAVLAAVVAAVLAGLLGARRVVAPLEALVGITRRIAQREWARVDPPIAGRGDEVGALARAFDTMSESLESSEAQLVKETQTRAALSRYLPADVVELAVKDPSTIRLGGERRTVTVLFADVVGFTRLAESLPPETVVAVLNELFTFATEIVHQRGGIIDKFIGDCVMAVWGVPNEKPQDARHALDAAEALRRWLDVGNRRWKQKYGVEVQLAMGVHTGPAIAGNVGSERRMEYTVIGDTVNVAARLEASAAPNQILVSSATRQALGDDAELAEVGERSLRGRSQTTMVYEVRS
jgi:class 3 adenylate cyclase